MYHIGTCFIVLNVLVPSCPMGVCDYIHKNNAVLPDPGWFSILDFPYTHALWTGV